MEKTLASHLAACTEEKTKTTKALEELKGLFTALTKDMQSIRAYIDTSSGIQTGLRIGGKVLMSVIFIISVLLNLYLVFIQ